MSIKCDYCGKAKEEEIFVIGVSIEPEWCMICGTGKMACPECYEKAMKEGEEAVTKNMKIKGRQNE